MMNLIRFSGALVLCFSAAIAAPMKHTSSYSKVTIDLDAVEKLPKDIRGMANAIHKDHGIRVLLFDRKGNVNDFSWTDKSRPLSKEDKEELSRQVAVAIKGDGRMGTSDFIGWVAGMAFGPYDRFGEDTTKKRPLESEPIILISDLEIATLRHEFLHQLFEKAYPEKPVKVGVDIIAHGVAENWKLIEAVKAEKLAEAAAKKDPSSANLRKWIEAGVEFGILKAQSIRYTARKEFDVMEAELLHRKHWDLSKSEIEMRVFYFATQSFRLASFKDSALKEGPFKHVKFSQMTEEDVAGLKKRMDKLFPEFDLMADWFEQADLFVNQKDLVSYLPPEFRRDREKK
jgi:hypothetical protein